MADFMSELRDWLTTSAPSPVASGSIKIGRLPDTPAQAAALFDTAGQSQAHNPIFTKGVSVETRGATRDEGLTLANQIYEQLHAGAGSTFLGVSGTDYYFYSAVANSPPQQAGVDRNNRILWRFDLNIIARGI